MVSQDLVSTGFINDLLPYNTKPLSKPMSPLKYKTLGPWQYDSYFADNILSLIFSMKIVVIKILILKIVTRTQRVYLHIMEIP